MRLALNCYLVMKHQPPGSVQKTNLAVSQHWFRVGKDNDSRISVTLEHLEYSLQMNLARCLCIFSIDAMLLAVCRAQTTDTYIYLN